MAKKIVCPNCKLPIEEDSKTCKFCGASIVEEVVPEEVEELEESNIESPKVKKSIPSFYLFFIIAAGLSVLAFFLPILPIDFNQYLYPIYVITFNSPIMVGMNAGTISFVFAIVTLLCFAAVHWSIFKKTTEIALFSYFAAFFAQVTAICAALAPLMLSSGNSEMELGFSLGFVVIAIFFEAIVALTIIAIIQYKKYLIKNPSEVASIK